MIVTAYRGGFKKGESINPLKGSYGFKVSIRDRDSFFKKEWDYIILSLEGEEKEFKVLIEKDSFWSGGCRELIHKNIKKWFFKNKVIPWERGKPPRIKLENISGNKFKAILL